MIRALAAIVLVVGLAAGAAGGYWYARPPVVTVAFAAQSATPVAERKILYYREPSGAPYWSAVPKKDASGRDYLPVYDDEEMSFDPAPKKSVAISGPRRVRYYRNPMGLPDTSPVPKKDNMGMDYIPVYEGEQQDDGKTVKVSLDKIQRSGVRTEPVQERSIVHPVRAVGTVKTDERLLTTVTVRSDGYVEDLFVNATGQPVHKGEPLFRFYSPDIQTAQVDLIVSAGPKANSPLGVDTRGPVQRLRNLGVPETRIEEVRATGTNMRTLDWPSPTTGTVIYKGIMNGQQVKAGAELYRIADLTHMWVIAEVAEADLSSIAVGTSASVTVRAYPNEPFEGRVTFIYPDIKPETRTARVRIEVPNPDGRLKIDMYADVVFHTGVDKGPVVAVPASAVIDSGTRQVVLVAKGDGRFEPRPVKLGRRGDGYIEILSGVAKGEDVVTSATFLIDAESNLKAALQAFTQQETTP
ncbi:MAG TPA: efflux RND transporter periplasmic adaptor subunit [Pseudolabrys sp.]|nr:efflux RND transporter periplasmic adaptor subunit [Pseudolabrys sp.]